MAPQLLATFLLALPPNAESPPPASQPTTSGFDSRSEKRAHNLARIVAQTLRDARFLMMEIDIRASPYHLRVVTEMAPARFRTRVYDVSDRSIRAADGPDAAFLLKDGIVSEYRAAWQAPGKQPLKNVLIQYPAVFLKRLDGQERWVADPNGSGDAFLEQHIDCLFGSYLSTWVGPFSRQADYHKKVVQEGVIRAIPDRVQGMDCAVVPREPPPAGGYHRRDLYWFDQDLGLLRRWHTLESDGGAEPTLTRQREYRTVELRDEEPDVDIWNLDFVQAERRRTITQSVK